MADDCKTSGLIYTTRAFPPLFLFFFSRGGFARSGNWIGGVVEKKCSKKLQDISRTAGMRVSM